MHLDSICNVYNALENIVSTTALGDMSNINAKEFGEVIDAMKDCIEIKKLDEEAKYYCSITKAMEKRSESDDTQEKIDSALMMERLRNQQDNVQNYYGGVRMRYPYYIDQNRMYYDMNGGQGGNYSGNMGNGNGMNSGRGYSQSYSSIPNNMRDYREGRSYVGRRGYMESKESHEPEPVKMNKLEEYIKELGEDITEMIQDASPTEKDTLRDKLTRLAQQIV